MEDLKEEALKNKEFIVYYQPKIDLRDNCICGAEALVRWLRPQIGLIPPNKFIPTFEEDGFIIQLDLYVLEQVCHFLREKINAGYEVFPISVNFSRAHFKTNLLPERLLQLTQKYNIKPELIQVEITESAFVDNDKYFKPILKQILDKGFSLAMDDFGSGLSSLNLLCDLPFKTLKIDKDFFHSNTTHKKERIIISSIVHMASELNMDVICEGVETKEQSDFLKSIGCYSCQGYYYSRPLPEDLFVQQYLQQKKEQEV